MINEQSLQGERGCFSGVTYTRSIQLWPLVPRDGLKPVDTTYIESQWATSAVVVVVYNERKHAVTVTAHIDVALPLGCRKSYNTINKLLNHVQS